MRLKCVHLLRVATVIPLQGEPAYSFLVFITYQVSLERRCAHTDMSKSTKFFLIAVFLSPATGSSFQVPTPAAHAQMLKITTDRSS